MKVAASTEQDFRRAVRQLCERCHGLLSAFSDSVQGVQSDAVADAMQAVMKYAN
jgi:hypothetical protein